jgi:hypothetical protein
MISIGIDPGWKNLGYSVVEIEPKNNEVKLLESGVFNPSSFSDIEDFIIYGLNNSFTNGLKLEKIDYVTIERFISYQGVDSAEFEIINRLIGAMCLYFRAMKNVTPTLYRAIDWKMELVKALFRQKSFENPSDKLDKKFSIAAAEACISPLATKLSTDHESDATCLASMPFYCPKATKLELTKALLK